MTLRRRLLLVYLIVVLLSFATVSVAMFELWRGRQMIKQIQEWNDVVLSVQKLKAAGPADINLKALLAEQFRYLADSPSTPGEDRVRNRVRQALRAVYAGHDAWEQLAPQEQGRAVDLVLGPMESLTRVLEEELAAINEQADRQDIRARILLAVVIGLTGLHVTIIGSLLRRWLLWPMERLNRQVEALARDAPPDEPLLTSPREMAALATALDRARCSLGELRRKLIESERLTTIGQLAAQLAHNLRNPLASIRATAQLAARQGSQDETLRGRMAEIIAAVDRLNQWINGLMEAVRPVSSPTRDADVRPTIERVCRAVEPDLSAKELRLELRLPAGRLLCRHDPATVEHALIAMVVNAIEASPLGGRIIISAGAAGPEASGGVCVAVLDEGPGFTMEDPGQIFEFPSSTKQRGMGLGLSLARQALKRQGADAGAERRAEGGARVYITLPPAETAGG